MSMFLDVDMGVLARPWDGYATYAQQVRKEYAVYDDSAFRTGRAKVLRGFLAGLTPIQEVPSEGELVQGCIFSTQAYVTGGQEAAARANVEREAGILEGDDPSAWALVMGELAPTGQ